MQDLCAYNIGGQLFTPNLIVEGLLRGNTSVLAASDPRFGLVCKAGNGVTLLSLSDGSLAMPRPRVYVEATWHDDLKQNVAAWLATKDVVGFTTSMNEIQLPRLLKLYLEEFGGKTDTLAAAISELLPPSAREFLGEVVDAKADLAVRWLDAVEGSW